MLSHVYHTSCWRWDASTCVSYQVFEDGMLARVSYWVVRNGMLAQVKDVYHSDHLCSLKIFQYSFLLCWFISITPE